MWGSSSVQDAVTSIETLVETVRRHQNDLLLVVLAFDGVLAEYHDDPDAVQLPRSRRAALDRLRRQPGVVLGIVSGRRVDDLRQRAGLGDGVFYIGLHGLEAVGPGFTHVERQILETYREHFRDIISALEPAISRIDGARLEDKDAAIALHTRRAGPVDTVWARLHMLNQAADLVNTQALRPFRGNHVLELLPNVGFARADAIAIVQSYLERRSGRQVFTVYVGEDATDDDGCRAVAERGVAVVVGQRGGPADYRLPSTQAVEALIAAMTDLRGGTP